MVTVPSTEAVLRWTTALACGYETTAIIGRSLQSDFPMPTITRFTHENRHRRSTYVVAGGIIGLLFHHLLVEALDLGE